MNTRIIFRLKTLHGLLVLLIFTSFIIGVPQTASAQTGSINWDERINISQSPNMTSTDPFLLGDPAGLAHLFWAEKVFNVPGNVPDTVMYAAWDGQNWSQPIDVHFSPPSHGNQVVAFPHAVIDGNGIIHLIWLAQPNFPNYTLFYSWSHSNQAINQSGWSPPVAIAEDLTGTNYSIDIKVDSQQHLHIVYSRVPAGDSPPELRATTYVSSTDSGETWSEPIDIYTVSVPSNGTSNTRLLIDDDDNIFASWSVWDRTGNGQAIGFARSMDNGLTWEAPILIAERIGNEYERDWNNMAYLGDNTIVAFWEGGWRAYRHVMYSYDAGLTWTDPTDIFPGLIGENGFVEFVRDGDGNLHLFYSQRTREGNNLRSGFGLWHSVWEGGTRWREPTLSGGNYPMLNPKVAIINGNQIVSTWYTSPEFEIWVMTGTIIGVTSVLPQLWEIVEMEPENTSTPETNIVLSTPVHEQPVLILETEPSSSHLGDNPGMVILLGIFPSFFIVSIVFLIVRQNRR
ncbi:MAG: exo-alpha-sialidase [Anaerolineales bacterium]|nr:exo-alpha-sialidase [Anaerolineales bacterium]